jgi:hypothetical protein
VFFLEVRLEPDARKKVYWNRIMQAMQAADKK